MEKVNVNQMALPGMENMSHPLARHLAGENGLTFHFFHDRRNRLYSLDAADHRHAREAGHMEWGASNTDMRYPGEIGMIENESAHIKGGYRRGLAADMYHAGHKIDMGQETVPVHSPDRTYEGDRFSSRVGGPRPRNNDEDWRPPHGLHPFEQEDLRRQDVHMKGLIERNHRNLQPKLFEEN